MTEPRSSALSFPPFHIPEEADVLYRGDEVVPLERQAVRVLRYLAEHRDRVVSKDELLEHVWPDSFTTDTVLKRAVSLARRALGDDQDAPRFIRTFHRQGYQFVAPVAEGTPAVAPAPTVVVEERRTPHNLAHPLTTFVGRRDALEALEREIASARLVTMHGPGGMGKTRLATELAWRSLDAFPDGVWFVELAPTSDPALVAAAVAGAMGVREEPARSLAAAIAGAVGDRRVLVVLDNCEHVVEASADLAERLLGDCPNLRLLATSRAPLDVPGETVWPVAALDLPDTGDLLSLERLAERAAVRLFLDRARSARPDLVLADENAKAVADLCRALDGLPLAIELAAARARTMSVDEILARMADRFALLARTRSATGERHRTLRATIDWSYDMLSPAARTLFGRLAVFEGGCTVEAATRVCSGPTGLDGDAFELLSHLVEKALVVAEGRGAETRYRMLESIREYAADRLGEAGEEDDLRRRHRDWYIVWSERFHESTVDHNYTRWRAEQYDLRAALRWSLERPDELDAALQLCLNLAHAWRITGNLSEGRRWLEALLERTAHLPLDGRAKATALAGALASEQSDYPRARPLLEEAVRLHREEGASLDFAIACLNLAYALDHLGESDAAAGYRAEAADLLRQSGDERAVAITFQEIGSGARERGDFDAALGLYEQALDALRRVGDTLNAGVVLYNLGELAVDRGEFESADALLAESRTIARELQVPRVEAYALHMTAFAAVGMGQRERAAGLLRDALAIHREQRNDEGVAYVLTGFAMLAASGGEWERALELAGAIDALRERIGVHTTRADRLLLDRALEPARRAFGDEASERAVAAGRRMAADEVLARATLAGAQTADDVTRPTSEGSIAPAAAGGGPLVGRVLDGRYRLEATLGRGGMGEVYRATDLRLGRGVAVKTLLTSMRGRPDLLKRFEREAQLVSRLRHPNIVAVHDVGRTSDDLLYIVMELLEGRSLRDELRAGPMAADRAAAVMRQVCSAVAAAHVAGVVHRDLKPDNLFLEGEDATVHAKVLDFGVARMTGLDDSDAAPITRPGAILGTAHYMSPEQCEGQSADARSDVYALGCILYEMVTGEPPFAAASTPALLHKHVHEAPRRPGELAADLPAWLEEAILRAMRKAPAERFATAGDLGRALAGSGSLRVRSASALARHDDLDRDAAEGRVTRERVDREVVGQVVEARPGVGVRRPKARPLSVVPPPVGDADDARHDGVGHLDLNLDLPHARAHARHLAVDEAAPRGVVGVDHQRAPRLAAHEAAAVVQPRVVAPEVAPPDEQEPLAVDLGRRLAEEPLAHPREVDGEDVGYELDAPGLRLQPLGQARLERPEVDAMRRGLEPPEREAVRERVPAWTVGAEPEAEVEQQLGAEDSQRGVEEPRAHAAPHVAGAHAVREVVEDLPLVARVRLGLEERRRVLRRVADREHVEDEVVVVVLERRGGRQDDVRVARRLVEVAVDRDHEVERLERPVELAAVRRREHRVAGDGHERADAPVAGRQDLLGERGDRELAAELRQSAHAAAAPRVVAALAGARGERHEVDRGLREHGPALAVEVAGDDVEQVDEPLGRGAELLGRDPHAAVADPGARRGEVARERARLVGRDTRDGGDTLGREVLGEPLDLLPPVGERFEAARPREPLLDDRVQHGEQQEDVRAGPDEVVVVGGSGRLGAPRVDDDDAAAPVADRLEPPADVGRGHQAPVRGERVRAQHEQEVGPVDVGDGQQERVPVHEVAHDVVRQLVDRGRREATVGAEGAREEHAEDERAPVVHRRVAGVEPHRVAPVLALDSREALGRLGERLVPRDLLPAVGGAPHGAAQAVRVRVDVLERGRLRADVAAAEGVLFVAADRDDAVALDLDLDPAHGFAEVAGAVVGVRHGRHCMRTGHGWHGRHGAHGLRSV